MGAASIALLLTLASFPDPFGTPAKARVLVFVRTDCPITNRYAPELQRIASEFAERGVSFWLVYSDGAESGPSISRHISDYHLPGTPVRDVRHELARRAQATVSPQAAVFDSQGNLLYTGRIDDRYAEIGKSRPAPTTHDLQSAITAVLTGRKPPVAKTRAIGCSLADLN